MSDVSPLIAPFYAGVVEAARYGYRSWDRDEFDEETLQAITEAVIAIAETTIPKDKYSDVAMYLIGVVEAFQEHMDIPEDADNSWTGKCICHRH